MNLLSLIQSQLSPQTVNQISSSVGESPDATRSALGTAFPALLGSLVGKSSASPAGAGEILNLIKQGQSQGGWSDAIGNYIGGGGGAPAQTHQSLLSSLLGPKLGAVADFISGRCGIRGTSAMSLLGMAAPLVMGTLGKFVSSQRMNASGLSQLLGSQTQYLKDAIPAGLANTLGIGSLLSGAPEPQKVDTAYTEPVKPAYRDVRPVEAEPVHAGGGGSLLKWAWVPILALLGIWFAAHRANRSDVGGTVDRTQREVGTARSWQAPDLSKLNLSPGGTADTLAKAIAAGDWSKSVDIQGVNMDGNGALSATSGSKLQEIGSVLSAAPSVKVQVTGFGDTEEAGLSRANTIKNAITATGVAADRITARGQTGAGMPTISLMR